MLATIENMTEHYADGVFAYSPDTGEEYSANPSDYFWAPAGYTLIDNNDTPMILASRKSEIVPI